MRSGPDVRRRMLASRSACAAMARAAAWPSTCVSCGHEELQRGPGDYWRCPRCSVDGGGKGV